MSTISPTPRPTSTSTRSPRLWTARRARRVEATTGLVVRSSYLWAREHDRGEDAGRKDRPACVQVIVGRGGRPLSALFPITSRPPVETSSAIAVRAAEARRVGLRLPAWVIVDEWNEDDPSASPFLADPTPLGSFSASFCVALREGAVEALKAGKFRRVTR